MSDPKLIISSGQDYTGNDKQVNKPFKMSLGEYFTIRKSIFVYEVLNKTDICADQSRILCYFNSRKIDEDKDQFGAAINIDVRVLATLCFNDKV